MRFGIEFLRGDYRGGFLLGMSPFAHPSVIFRKELIEKWGGYDTNFTAAQDLELWSRLAPSTKMKNLSDSVLKYRKHNN